jgi:hypothetical protein
VKFIIRRRGIMAYILGGVIMYVGIAVFIAAFLDL